MKQTRDITFSFLIDLIRRAGIIAAECDISINALVEGILSQIIERSDEYRAAGKQLLAPSALGLFEMPQDRWTREEIYG